MSSLEDLPSWPVRQLVDAIGSTDHAPGDGAAGGVTIALAAACALKAIVITLKHAPDDADLEARAARLQRIAEAALDGAAGDAVAFAALIDAHQLPKDSASDSAAREAAIRERTARITRVGVELRALAIEVRSIAEAVRPAITPTMANDIGAAIVLATAGEKIQDDNIRESRGVSGQGA